ncbi:hypothetical protein [Sphingomonas sp. PR090111-T3T-6A]|uniref:hypothetical protein n=1 Tax=Sphingomonas sp. PR090111-T3T-6A TaxID=685778 RepID=UPI0012FCCA1A|nr:hypothetical protein [Sphingomonas sp. PR090111-T3T-6A]
MGGLLLGTLATPLLGVLPGFALLALLERFGGLRAGQGWERVGWALLLAFSVLPAIDALAIRFLDVPAAFAFRIALALVALRPLTGIVRRLDRIPRPMLLFAGLWWLVVAIAYVDVDWNGRLYQSLVVVDLVKHAAVVESIADYGLPLRDSFFARAQPAGYYYYFYCLPAEIRWVAGNLISARMAFASTLFWAGFALPAILWRVGAEAGLIGEGRERRFLLAAIFLCFIAGADLPFILIEHALNGYTLPQVELWSEEVRFALTSMLWVPHHMAALIACWTGAALLCRREPGWRRTDILPVVATGLCFGSAFGMSLWMALTAAPILAIWCLARLWRGDRATATALILAGVVAALVCLPQIIDILQGRSDQSFPIAPTVRSFAFWWLTPAHPDVTLALILLLLLPVGYAIQFGAFTIGSLLFLRAHPGETRQANAMRSLLLIAAIVSLIVASFFRSTIINNDLGWRSIWFAQFPAIVWTASLLHTLPGFFMRRGGFRILLLLGIAGNLWDMAGFRFIRPPHFRTHGPIPGTEPTTDFSEREAYEWAGRHLDGNLVIQHNAGLHPRVFNFGLYGRNRPGIADKDAILFGASRQQVADRLRALQPIFDIPMPLTDMQARARTQGVDFLLMADSDPSWKRQGTPPFLGNCVYRNAHACLLPTKAPTP